MLGFMGLCRGILPQEWRIKWSGKCKITWKLQFGCRVLGIRALGFSGFRVEGFRIKGWGSMFAAFV